MASRARLMTWADDMPAVERDELEGTPRRLGMGGGGGGGPFEVAAEFGTGRLPDIWFSGKFLGTGCDAEPTDEPASRSGHSMAEEG